MGQTETESLLSTHKRTPCKTEAGADSEFSHIRVASLRQVGGSPWVPETACLAWADSSLRARWKYVGATLSLHKSDSRGSLRRVYLEGTV